MRLGPNSFQPESHEDFNESARGLLYFQFPKEHRPHDHKTSFYDWHPHL